MKKGAVIFLICFYGHAYAQSILDTKLDGTEKGKSLTSYLLELEKPSAIRIYFLPEWTDKIFFNQGFEGTRLSEALRELFLGTDLSYVEINSNTLVLLKDPAQELQRKSVILAANREKKEIEKIKIGVPGTSGIKQRVIFSGSVVDEKSKSPLVGASVTAKGTNAGVVTNADGKFELSLIPGMHVISFSYVNYEERLTDLEIYSDGKISIELEETPTLLDEVVVQDKFAREITSSGIGQTQLSIKEIKKAPALLGEVDLIKQVQILPGVTTAGEAASGFNVRGGGVDQNLILYDGLPVFNSSHVFGFFSSFNSEAIRDVTFYRGGIPAEFGGRISSVLDIRSKEGNYENWEGSGGIGLVSSNVMVNGPIKRNKTSVAASIRTTYSDWLVNTVRSNYVNLNKSTVTFYDGTAKLTHLFRQKTIKKSTKIRR